MEVEELIHEWQKFRLMEDEKDAFISLNAEEAGVIKGQVDQYLVGKLLSNRNISKLAIKNALQGAWKTRRDFCVDILSKNVFLFNFESKDDRDWIWKNGSWMFDRSLVVLEAPEKNQRVADLNFKRSDFWLRIFNLPIGYRNEIIAKKIGNMIGEFMEMDKNENCGMWGNNIRIKVKLDISRPLKRGLMLKIDETGEQLWITIRYERIPDFCFHCGIIGHVAKECIKACVNKEENHFEFGSWMKF